MRAKRLVVAATAAALFTTGLVVATAPAQAATDICKAKNLAEAGGMDALVAAAKKEGQLNLITIDRTWANYDSILKTYEKAFGVKLVEDNPDGSSQYEIDTMKTAPKSKQPDVIDIGPLVLPQLTPPGAKPLSVPYKVANWNDIPTKVKDVDGYWYGDYAGKLAIVYNTSLPSAPSKASDFTKPEFAGVVGITGDPTSSNQAFMSLVAASIGNGGQKNLADVTPGLALWKSIKAAGPIQKVNATNIVSGTAKLGFSWDFNALSLVPKAAAAGVKLKFVYPSDYVYQASPYIQAINAKAPNCANARLWEEFIYSQNQGKTFAELTPADLKLSGSKLFAKLKGGQNYFQESGADPVMSAAMKKKGVLSESKLDFTVPSTAKIVGPSTISEIIAAREQVIGSWATL